MDLKYSVGIDVGYRQMAAWIEKYRKDKGLSVVVNMEASGVYHENCAYYLHKKGYRISITLANKATQYLKLIGKSKNDKLDAKGLARMGAEQHLRQWQYKIRRRQNRANCTPLSIVLIKIVG